MPVISVVVPVYKVEKYLAQCITSIQNQTFADIEIIMVDDGSPDKCGEICDGFAKEDKRIRVIHQENGGLSYARNVGVQLAQGEYICFVDSDDYIATDYCEVLYELLCNSKYDYSVCGACRFAEDKNPEPVHKAIQGTFSNIEFLGMQLTRKTEFGVWNKLYRREILDKICFATGRIHEDVIWSADLARQCTNGVICTNKELYFYRQNNSGIVKQGARKCSPDRIFAGEYLLKTIKKLLPERYKDALKYAIEYPWMFIDPIYVHREFDWNKEFLKEMHRYLKDYLPEYEKHNIFSSIWLSRMKLFVRSKKLYAINVYARLFRVYLYRILHLDAYKDGHGV